MIERKKYLEQLTGKRGNGLVKVITGVQGCGKSYLLFHIYRDYLRSAGVKEECIITVIPGDNENDQCNSPMELEKYIRSRTCDKNKEYYVFLDKVQKAGIWDVVLKMAKSLNIDFYMTADDLKMLPCKDPYGSGGLDNLDILDSLDSLDEFAGKMIDMVHMAPLSYGEFYAAYAGDKTTAWREYVTYGGMPGLIAKNSPEEKEKYLQELYDNIYLDGIMERHKILHEKTALGGILDILAASSGSPTNPRKLAKAMKDACQVDISNVTVSRYLGFFMDAFLIHKVGRYDVKRRRAIGSPVKYYVSDNGLFSARQRFFLPEEKCILENILYNELCYRGFDIHAGVLEYGYKDENKISKRMHLEIDFVADKGSKRYYIQLALTEDKGENRLQAARPLRYVRDSFKKIVVVKEDIAPWNDEYGILYIGIERFLLEENSMDM